MKNVGKQVNAGEKRGMPECTLSLPPDHALIIIMASSTGLILWQTVPRNHQHWGGSDCCLVQHHHWMA
jgi:hypothetical protein